MYPDTCFYLPDQVLWCKSRLWFSVSDCSLFYSVRSESNKEYLAICPSYFKTEPHTVGGTITEQLLSFGTDTYRQSSHWKWNDRQVSFQVQPLSGVSKCIGWRSGSNHDRCTCWQLGNRNSFFNDYSKKMNVVMYDAEHQKIKEILKRTGSSNLTRLYRSTKIIWHIYLKLQRHWIIRNMSVFKETAI